MHSNVQPKAVPIAAPRTPSVREGTDTKNEQIGQQGFQSQRDHRHHHGQLHHGDAAQDRNIGDGDRHHDIAETDDAQVLASQPDDLLVLRIKAHQALRDQSGCQGEARGHQDCKRKADPQHLVNVLNIPLAPVLGGKDGHAACHAEQEQDQQKEDLIRQAQSSDRGFPQPSHHQHIDHTQAGRDELLEGHRNGQCQHVTNENAVAQKGKIHKRKRGIRI